MKQAFAILGCALALHSAAQQMPAPAAQPGAAAQWTPGQPGETSLAQQTPGQPAAASLAQQIPGQPGASDRQPAYFIDGYHGGIYGHLPSWQTRFMVDKLKQYPDWKINLELEPESWDSIALSDPAAYAEFQQLFADQSSGGRIEYVNPAYGQAYMYNISGESIIRQLYYGMKTLRKHFPGAVFSSYSSEEPCFTSALPQILRSYGFKYASLKNPNTCWGGYTRAYGGELVNWIGPDGTSILTVPRYEVEALKPRSIWETMASGNESSYVSAAFAYGIKHPVGMCLQDAGWAMGPWLKGGNYQPSYYETWRGYFENIAGVGAASGAGAASGNGAGAGAAVASRAGASSGADAAAGASALPGSRNMTAVQDWKFSQEDVQVGLMWGAQVLQRIARAVRVSENRIIQAEKMAAMAAIWKEAPWPDMLLQQGWRTLLLSQHHDCWIVPYNGKPGDTWADKVVSWTGLTLRNSDSIIRESGRLLSGADAGFFRVFNTTGVEREEYVHYNDGLYKVRVPAMGYATYRVGGSAKAASAKASAAASRAFAASAASATSSESAKGAAITNNGDNWQIETDLYRLTLDARRGGVITSWIAKQQGNRQLVKKDSAFNELRGNFYNDGGMRSSTEKRAEIRVISGGPEEIKIDIKGSIAGTPFIQTLTLYQGKPRVDLHLKIDWKENHAIGEYFDNPKNEEVRKAYYDDRYKLLTLFPLQLDSQKVYKNAPFDVTASRLDNTFYNRWDSIKNNVLLNWVDVTDGKGDYGVALFSDHTTSYSHGSDFPLGLTIQYSGNGIFYRNYTIDGVTELNYALLPHTGKWDRAGIWTEGAKWNEPLITCPAGQGASGSLLTPDKGIEVTSLRMDKNALLVRLFNAESGKPVCRLYLGFSANSAEEMELDGRLIQKLPLHKDRQGRRWVEVKLSQFKLTTIKIDHV